MNSALRYDNDWSPFCGLFSQFSVTFPSGRPMGMGALHPRATLSTYQVADPLLQLWIEPEGHDHLVPVSRERLDSFPHTAKEFGRFFVAGVEIQVTTRCVFTGTKEMVLEMVFRNTGKRETMFRPHWVGCFHPDDRRYMLPFFPAASRLARETFVKADGSHICGGLHKGEQGSELPEVTVDIQAWSSSGTRSRPLAALLSAPPWAGGRPIPALSAFDADSYCFSLPDLLQLQPGQARSYQFLVSVEISEEKIVSVPAERSLPLNIDEATERAAERWRKSLGEDQFADAAVQPMSAWTSHALRARLALVRSGVSGGGGRFGDEIACLCTADASDFSCVFFWDTLFSSAAISSFNRPYAQGAMRTAFVGQDERDGSSPERKWNYSVPHRMAQQSPQSPVGAWALRHYIERYGPDDFARDIYRSLVLNHQFWLTCDTDRDGLAEYRWSGQVCDNSPLWDWYSNHNNLGGCGWLPPVASVALNSFLIWDAKHLAALASELDVPGDVERWKERATSLERALMSVCYVPAERRFWDYNHHLRAHRRVKTAFMFWPLLAGVQMPQSTLSELLDDVLLDPAQFYGAVPFPTVAYDEETYSAKGYWRGRAWPHISYWLLETLVNHGRKDAAVEASERLLDYASAQEGFRENFCTAPGEREAGGFKDYNWGAAAFILMASGQFLKPSKI